MGKLIRSKGPMPLELGPFDGMLASLNYTGPDIYLHVLKAQRRDEVIVLVWRDQSEVTETETPTFSTKGTKHQCFMALKQSFSDEGWIQS